MKDFLNTCPAPSNILKAVGQLALVVESIFNINEDGNARVGKVKRLIQVNRKYLSSINASSERYFNQLVIISSNPLDDISFKEID